MASNSLTDLLRFVQAHTLRTTAAGNRSVLRASESDKGRIVNAAAFRRLQQKAQVFPLDPNASVRTRLTHSIEVSQLGRYLAQSVIEKLGSSSAPYSELAAFVNVVENACLLHDIGNPPFGHLGEAAIQSWFKTYRPSEVDLTLFDGNPQGFRLMSLLCGRDAYGFNLTCSLLLSTIKYPWTAVNVPTDAKIGVFDMEWPTYQEACRTVGWPEGKRFPFVLLMEAADDIAYSMSDLEDGLEKNIVRLEDLKDTFGPGRFESSSVREIVKFRTDVINAAIDAAATNFAANLPAILDGDTVRLLAKDSPIGEFLENVKSYARRKIYSHPAAERVELAGRSVLSGLLTHFNELLELDEEQFAGLLKQDRKFEKKLSFQTRLLRLITSSYKEKYQLATRGSESNRRAHLVVDFVAGMTDHYALETYQVLQGIRIQ